MVNGRDRRQRLGGTAALLHDLTKPYARGVVGGEDLAHLSVREEETEGWK
jgi:hypothetical protein